MWVAALQLAEPVVQYLKRHGSPIRYSYVAYACRRLRAVDGPISGLHGPRATHLAILRQALAAAGCAGPSAHLDRAYDEARRAGYLRHEFGDSHLIIGDRRRHGFSRLSGQ